MGEKLMIVGGGLAGLSAGIYARYAGWEVTLCEMSDRVGGCCSGWTRRGCLIDNCIHWLCGTANGVSQNRLWREIGALSDDVPILRREEITSSELGGRRATLWRDLERTRRELTELSPADAPEIDRLIENARLVGKMSVCEKPGAALSAFWKETRRRWRLAFLNEKLSYLSLTIGEYAQKFQDPLLRQLILDFCVPEYECYWLFLTYGMVAGGNGDIPAGGSEGLSRRVGARFEELGGRICLSTEITKIHFSGNRAVSAESADGVIFPCDRLLLACDLHEAYDRLLGWEAAPKGLREDFERLPAASSFQAAFLVHDLCEGISDTLTFPCAPFSCAGREFDRLWMKNYRHYGPEVAPEGCTVVQCNLPQYAKESEFWRAASQNPDFYRAEKARVADEVAARLIERFPELAGKVECLDTWTPQSYAKRQANWRGEYMRYFSGVNGPGAFLPLKPKGLKNVYFAGHRLRYPGGTPTAAATGRDVVTLMKKDRK